MAASLVCALVVALALTMTGCGGSNQQFSTAEADRALAALDAIQEYVDAGRCQRAAKRVNQLAVQSTHVNSDRSELGEAYASSVARLQALVTRECVEIMPTAPTTEVTAATGSTGTNDGPTPVEPTGGGNDTPVTPDNGNGNGNGNGDGNGNGGANGNNGGQNQTPASPPDNSGGAGPGT